MKFEIVLGKDDYLVYHLYKAAASPGLKKRRLLHWAGVPLTYLVTALLLRILKSPEMVQVIFVTTAILWLLLYPVYSRWAIPAYMGRQISQKYAGMLDKAATMDISKSGIEVKNSENSLKVSYGQVTGIVELSGHFLVDLESGVSLIVPKSQIPQSELAKGIGLVAEKSGREISDRTRWSWK